MKEDFPVLLDVILSFRHPGEPTTYSVSSNLTLPWRHRTLSFLRESISATDRAIITPICRNVKDVFERYRAVIKWGQIRCVPTD